MSLIEQNSKLKAYLEQVYLFREKNSEVFYCRKTKYDFAFSLR